jgi:hypothetical protein
MLFVLVFYKSIKSVAIRILRKRIGAQDDADIYFLCESNVSLKRRCSGL